MTQPFLYFLALALLQDSGGADLERLPLDLALSEEGPQRYVFTCDYLATDAEDAFVRKHRIQATYVRNLEDSKVRWEDASLSRSSALEDEFPPGEPLPYMAGFSYAPEAGFAMFLPAFFEGFPSSPEAAFAKNLVWDTHMLEQFGWSYFADLKLGEPFSPSALTGSRIPLAGMGAFKNRRIEITWLGRSRANGESCALLGYEAFFNRFDLSLGATRMEGLSHYWGSIWVSLEDKQIERATLNEHVSLREVGSGGETRRHAVLRQGSLRKIASPR